ncbi:glycosyltransferase [Albimonas sp. CAU 1670]|uniref:glycosyltransferase family protein n=1 Tax=Albimonas sp. CAU 1670 TaxID=3032599 RepID=UPI0023D9F8EA|nr:glycosyltransferase [Albimonas sp. CAU 1670]MDF2234306.1 glycosyltransferase [Albimonas sp. CAU 1670]
MSAPRIALLVTHLMGSGHLVRTLTLARALAAQGADPLVISGGRPLGHVEAGGVRLAQLPPLSSNGLDYRTLLDDAGAPASDAYRAEREARLVELIRAETPAALVTELYPLGRRNLEAEFRAAIAALPPGARLIGSVRDVMEPPSKAKRVAQGLERLAPFDALLVHGDPEVIPLAASWPGDGTWPEALARRVRYAGYAVDPAPPRTAGPGEGEVLVATGGGAIGRRLLEVAARASALSDLPWRLRVGGADAAGAVAALSALGPAAVEPAAPDFRARLSRAAAAVTLCGYNTAVEAALSGTPTLLVPMEEGGEREQLIRAEAFARLPEIETARIGALTPEGLAERVAALAAQPRRAAPIKADGGAEAARIVLETLA